MYFSVPVFSTMGGCLLVFFSNIYLTKLEKNQVKPLKPKFYRKFVDDVIGSLTNIPVYSTLKRRGNVRFQVASTWIKRGAFVERRLKNTHDSLLENLNNYLEKIKYSIETNLQKFLYSQILLENDIITTEVYRKV